VESDLTSPSTYVLGSHRAGIDSHVGAAAVGRCSRTGTFISRCVYYHSLPQAPTFVHVVGIEKNWTKTHGYFIQMGGFMLYEKDRALGILSPKKLKGLYEDGRIDIPKVTEEEIQDHSKADGLAKIIVVGQTTWFIMQCIARGVQGLVLTQLELVTLAFAFLNAFMYFLWWNKPMDVECSVPVYLLEVPKGKQVPLKGEYSSNCKI
jgi:hypothetical protein